MTELLDLRFQEVSLVDAGANPEANILLFKRKDEQNMTEEKNVSAKNIEKAAKNVEEDTAVKKSDEAVELERERAELAKAQETVNGLIATLTEQVEKAETSELLKVAAKYEILGHKAEDLAKQLKSLKPFPELYQTVIQSFDNALAVVEKARTFDEIGKTGRGTGTAQIDAIADEIQKSNPELSRRAAIDKAFQAHPELQF